MINISYRDITAENRWLQHFHLPRDQTPKYVEAKGLTENTENSEKPKEPKKRGERETHNHSKKLKKVEREGRNHKN